MKVPSKPGTIIDSERVGHWLELFSNYRSSVTATTVESWLRLFDSKDKDLAARILDCVEFVSSERISSALSSSLAKLELYGWSKYKSKRKGKWRFVAFSSSSGESGDKLLYDFRIANGLTGRPYDELFIGVSQIPSQMLGPEDTVVFVDDFAGSGKQACEAWKQFIGELLATGPKAFLILVVATRSARVKINNDTELTVLSDFELTESDNVFSDRCQEFTGAEKKLLFTYCKKADSKIPKGYGDCGLVLVLAHGCPNNTIPILHSRKNRWRGLFPRHPQ